jgi:membrane-associated HD superfamily phosphohydrolase
VRLGVWFAACLVLWAVTGAGDPPFAFRTGDVPARKIVARVTFELPNDAETDKRRDEARRTAESVYVNNVRLLEEVRQGLTNKVSQLVQAMDFEKVDQKLWAEFSPPDPQRPADEDKRRFDAIKAYFTAGMDSGRYDEAVKRALEPIQRSGVLKEKDPRDKGSQISLLIHEAGGDRPSHRATIDEVRIDKVKGSLKQRLLDELKVQDTGMMASTSVVADLTYAWLDSHLPETLSFDQEASLKEADRAASEVKPATTVYEADVAELAAGGKPLTEPNIELLRHEDRAWKERLGWQDRLGRSLAIFGMFVAISILCGFYIYHRRPRLLTDMRRYATLLATIAVTVTVCWVVAADPWHAEIIPLLLFGMTAAIAYEKELALLLAACVALMVAFARAQGLAEFVILVSAIAAAILLLRRIRSRTKLIYVGAFAGLVVMLTTMGVGTLTGRAFGVTSLAMS